MRVSKSSPNGYTALNILLLTVIPVLACFAVTREPVEAIESMDIRPLFSQPTRHYSSGPLWVWNDMLTDEQITSTLNDLAGQKVKQVFVHPRPGLMTPYLSDEWFRLWKVALQEAEKLDMNVWIYDENSYPSGFAGGLVPEAMPESRGQGMVLRERKQPPKWSSRTLAVFRLHDDRYENITEAVRRGKKMPEGSYLVAVLQQARSGGWFGGKYYVDLLYPGVTEKFLEITMDAYEREVGDEFGKRVPGVFTDEPHLAPAGGLHWSVDLEQEFRKRWGYDLIDHLPSLARPVGDWKRIRHNYYNLLLEMFIDRWARPCYEYCEQHGLEFTGHYWEHGWPGASHGGDNMAMYAWHQRPAIDTLMNQYSEATNAQFGNVRAVKELSSVANQLGRKRTLCEAYGAGGWDLRFEDMKRIGDWLYVLGVNTLNEHLSYVTIRGARKRDHPQSFSYHEPWWEAYHVMAEYFTRLSVALSHGEEINEILVIEPTSTTWMYQGENEQLKRVGDNFQQLVVALSKSQVEYDIGCEDIIARHGSVDGDRFVVGQRRYHTVVLPPLTETLNTKTVDLIQRFLKGKGTVLCCGDPPARVDGRLSERGTRLADSSGWKRVEPAGLIPTLASSDQDGLKVQRTEGDQGILFHQRRRFDDGDLLFLANTSIESSSSGTIKSAGRSVQRWDLETGTVSPYPFVKYEEGVAAKFNLAPCGSLLLFLSKEPGEPGAVASEKATVIPPVGPLELRRIEPNVLTLDYVDVTAKGETRKNVYFYEANRFAFQQNGMKGNPWDSAVQFRDELISKTFPADSGFEATYRFTIEDRVPKPLAVVIERPDLYQVSCNGEAVSPQKGSWWLDKAFGRVNIESAARIGANVLTIKASPMTIYHELESVYVLGDFTLRPEASGFVIAPAQPLAPGEWNRQGHPFYAAGVAYEQDYDIAQPAGRYKIRLPEWYGSVAKVVANGNLAGHIAYRPWECDVTEHIKPGKNTVEVTIIGTLRNTLGPHHNGDVLGSAWPSMFRKGPDTGPPPGNKYSTVGYGLFKPFDVCQY
jgi:hypothetical protein